eukprot:m51a1_g8124 hypothetical protein (187) ;mRNA; f:185883-187580
MSSSAKKTSDSAGDAVLRGLDERVVRALAGTGIRSLLPVQSAVVPEVLRGRDVLVRSSAKKTSDSAGDAVLRGLDERVVRALAGTGIRSLLPVQSAWCPREGHCYTLATSIDLSRMAALFKSVGLAVADAATEPADPVLMAAQAEAVAKAKASAKESPDHYTAPVGLWRQVDIGEKPPAKRPRTHA